MPIAELEKMIDGLDEENYEAAVKFILFLSESQKNKPDVDANGFTPSETAELKRRFADIQAGKYERHAV